MISSPGRSAVSTSGLSPGRRWNSAIGMRRPVPSGATVSTSASSARMATAMSEGWVAMHRSLAPSTAWMRLNPSSAAQPEPGWRLLQGLATS